MNRSFFKQHKWLGLLILSAQLAGCQTIGYYAQAVKGHANIMLNQRSIDDVLADPAITTETKSRLRYIIKVRKFATTELKLPHNDSYSRYVNTGRKYVVWNVVATPRYSIEPITSCFALVGCLSYRGYYAKQAALNQANKLKADGLDVYVGGVGAYSTLGWFADPALNTMLSRSEADMAALIFHELAHQQIYIKGDTRFNESFATAVEQIGLQQWAKGQSNKAAIQQYFSQQTKRQAIIQLILDAREAMHKAYQQKQNASQTQLAQIKQEQFDLLKQAYRQLSQQGGGTPGFDRFFATKLNHASLALFGEYHTWVGAFKQLFAHSQSDWSQFYTAVDQLSQLPVQIRDNRLSELIP